MSKLDKDRINYKALEDKLYKKAYKYSEVKEQLEVVAFDIVRFKDLDKGADLWKVQSSEDGDYIVALYEPEEKVAVSWEVKVSKASKDLDFYYKGDPIVSISSGKIGIPSNELDKVERYLPGKLANNNKLVKALLSELNKATLDEVLKKYPELI